MAYVEVSRYESNGQISGFRTGELSDILLEGSPFVDGKWDGDKYYVDVRTEEVKQRPEMLISQNAQTITANTAQMLTLGGLPLNCYVSIGAHRYFVDDGILEWSTPMTGAFPITVECFPFLDWHSEVTVIANN